MLECLVRDLQGREYLHYRVYGKQHTTPVALMTSDAKGEGCSAHWSRGRFVAPVLTPHRWCTGNHGHVTQLLESLDFFGRGRSSFFPFRQPLVPVVGVEDGR